MKKVYMRIVLLSIFSLTLALLAGCGGVGPDERSGRDQSRGGAQSIRLGTIVTDAVNFEGGDATDWKSFEVSSAEQITAEIYWDNFNIVGTFSMHDQYGSTLGSVRHAPGTQRDVITTTLPAAGLYYLRIRSDGGRSTYSIRVYTGPAREMDQWQDDPRPVFDRPL